MSPTVHGGRAGLPAKIFEYLHRPMHLRILLVGLLLASILVCANPVRAMPAPPRVVAPEAIVIDGWTGSVLYAKKPDQLHAPASTAKIMTALVVLERHVPLRSFVTVDATAASYGGSSAGLYQGERMSVWNLLHGMLLPSGNDAAVALADAVAGTTQRFAGLMNAEAIRLHLWHTHFLTPNGFDTPGQVTTARDLANLTRRAMEVSAFARIVDTRHWTARPTDSAAVHSWSNLNRLLWMSRAVNGVKTGTTPAAGACLVSSARQGGKWVIAVNLGSTEASRFTDGEALLTYGLAVDNPAPSALMV